jgi:adenylate cyclase ExoY
MKGNMSINSTVFYDPTNTAKKTIKQAKIKESITNNSKKRHNKKISNNLNPPITENPKNKVTHLKESNIDKLLRKNNVGIPANQAIKMQEVAKTSNTIFGIRPVENIARTLIEEGYPTKNFKVKGKSSNWGPQAGFICKNQHFSKKNGSEKDIKKFNAEIKHGLAKGHFKTTPLKISKARITELRDELNIIETANQDKNIMIYATSPSGEEESFIAVYDQQDDSYEILSAKDKVPIEVVCDLKLGKPLTADYDLLLLAPRIENFKTDAKDNRPGKMSIFKNKNIDQKDKIKHINENENQNFGNLTARSLDVVNQINTKLDRGYGLETVHHSDDAGNPGSNINDNFPATFFLPKKIDKFPEITIIKDKKMFDDFIMTIKNAGFHFEDHPLWNVPRRPSFEKAINFFENRC